MKISKVSDTNDSWPEREYKQADELNTNPEDESRKQRGKSKMAFKNQPYGWKNNAMEEKFISTDIELLEKICMKILKMKNLK